MPVPSTQEIRRALLEILRVGNPQSITAKEWITLAAGHLGITEAVQDLSLIQNRITEALQYLTEKHMISNPSRNTYMIMKKGQKVLEDKADTPDTDKKLDALPDELDLAGDDVVVADVDVNDDGAIAAVVDEVADVDVNDDGAIAAAVDEVADVDVNDDVAAVVDDAPVEVSPDLQDSQQDIAPENTLNSFDEVDPDMPKDDLPADDFSSIDTDTEDFSSAVNQALNIEDVFERHNAELADKVLMRAAGLTPEMFAVFVIDLLSKMGYNAFQTARYTPESGGSSMIQGVILDSKAKSPIYIHADKLSPGRTVGRSDMHDFADELAEKGGTGIFATTGEFSEQAGIYAQDERIMLIDGKKLAGLILANNFCVNVAKVFEVKELDEDSFNEYE